MFNLKARTGNIQMYMQNLKCIGSPVSKIWRVPKYENWSRDPDGAQFGSG